MVSIPSRGHRIGSGKSRNLFGHILKGSLERNKDVDWKLGKELFHPFLVFCSASTGHNKKVWCAQVRAANGERKKQEKENNDKLLGWFVLPLCMNLGNFPCHSFMSTPLQTNMEPKNCLFVNVFPFSKGACLGFQPFVFRSVCPPDVGWFDDIDTLQ